MFSLFLALLNLESLTLNVKLISCLHVIRRFLHIFILTPNVFIISDKKNHNYFHYKSTPAIYLAI